VVTEVPDYLLERSRERRDALGLGGDDGGVAPAPAADAGGGGAAPAPTAAAPVASAPAADVAVIEEPPEPDPAWVTAARTRPKIPMWVMPILILLPLWAYVYVAFLDEGAAASPTELGGELYAASGCVGCHGAAGDGGIGWPLWEGESILTFPDVAPMINWIRLGSARLEAELGAPAPYGDQDRPGGGRDTGQRSAQMNGFGGSLSPSEIYALTRYVRETLSGEELSEAQLQARDVVYESLTEFGEVSIDEELSSLDVDVDNLIGTTGGG
jgi:mono/diheme cytochrome c family protein